MHSDHDSDPSALEQARAACEQREWRAAFDRLRDADAAGTLEPAGLELLAECARWVGEMDHVIDPLERAHARYAEGTDHAAAARTALALCIANADAGNEALVGSWWERGSRLLEGLEEGPEHAVQAWLTARQHGDACDLDRHRSFAERALAIARRHGVRNVEALALCELGHVESARGRSTQAMAALKQATSMAIGGELGLWATGFVFCSAIWACRSRGEWAQAEQWADSSDRWLERVGIDYFPAFCRVHRTEVLRVRGSLERAEQEILPATERFSLRVPRWEKVAQAELGEVRRRLGDLSGAMTAFRRALELGWDPQPGLALVQLAQGDAAGAHRGLERTFNEPRPTWLAEDRANLLAARVTVAIAAGALEVAERAVGELAELADRNETAWDHAAAAQARGELALAHGEAAAAVEQLAQARARWAELDAPFELARCGGVLAAALDASGDPSGAALARDAARAGFERIGALADRDRLGGGGERPPQAAAGEAGPSHGVFRREGDVWHVALDDCDIRLKDARGLRYVAALLAQPGVERFAVDLAAPTGAPDDPRAADRGDAGEILDDEARA
ncbi:MAG: hypothetical protein ACYTGX_13375, partial [Planctomycetota bacterium]